MFKLMKIASMLRVQFTAFTIDGTECHKFDTLCWISLVHVVNVCVRALVRLRVLLRRENRRGGRPRWLVAKQKGIWDGELMSDPYTEYSLSLYHAVMVMFTIDMNFKPESNLERWTTLFFACTGAVVVLFSLTSATNIYHDTFGRQMRLYKSRIDHVNEFIKRKKLPDQLSNDIIDFYEHLRNRDHFSN